MSVNFDHIPFGFGRPAAQTAREIEDVTFEDITDNQGPQNTDDSGAARARRKQVAAAAMEFANRNTAGKTDDPAFYIIASLTSLPELIGVMKMCHPLLMPGNSGANVLKRPKNTERTL